MWGIRVSENGEIVILSWTACSIREFGSRDVSHEDHLNSAPPLRLALSSRRNMYVFADGSLQPGRNIIAGIGMLCLTGPATPYITSPPKFRRPFYEAEFAVVIVAFEIRP